ncbi:MAG: hypothetical protein AAB569_04480 [Patescibacteria group bacterium]
MALSLSVVSFIYYYDQGLITAYGDATTHLNVARRTIDNITPGMAQLGGIWLPLLHVLMLPTIWNDFFWFSGISGSIVSMPAFILSVLIIYKLIYFLTKDKYKAVLGSALMALNINFLYLQTTPMTEALFVTTLISGVYLLTKWANDQRIFYLIAAAFFFFLTSINRYEGWPVALTATFVVFIISLFREGAKKAEGKILLFGTVSFFGIFLWMLWQLTIFHNAFYFLSSDFSAKGQTAIYIRQGLIPTYHNFLVSLKTNLFSLIHVLGPIAVFTAIIGLVYSTTRLIINKVYKNYITRYLPLSILFVPFVFLTYALYNGNIPMNVPETAVKGTTLTFFNVRYALYSLPAVAIFFAILAQNRVMKILLVFLILVNSYFLLNQGLNKIVTLRDARESELAEIKPTYNWIRRYYDGGYILVSATIADPLIFGTRLRMKNFITEGSGKYWTESMKNPAKYANWVILTTSERDMVRKYMNKNAFDSNFSLVQRYDAFEIYKKNDL